MLRSTLFTCSLLALGLAGSPAGAEVATELLNHDREKVKEVSAARQEPARDRAPQPAEARTAEPAQPAAVQACPVPQDPAATGEQPEQLARESRPYAPLPAWQASH